MKNHWFLSDPHFFHNNILKYCRRTKWMTSQEIELLDSEARFSVSDESVARMNQELIKNINSCAQKDDTLWILGDLCMGVRNRNYHDACRQIVEQFDCQDIHFIYGNHDQRGLGYLFNSDHEAVMVAINKINGDYILGEGEIQKFRPKGEYATFRLSHYAYAVWGASHKGVMNLYGHSHQNAEEWLDKIMPGRRSMDVGVDNAFVLLDEYRPFSLEEVLEILDKKPGFSGDHH